LGQETQHHRPTNGEVERKWDAREKMKEDGRNPGKKALIDRKKSYRKTDRLKGKRGGSHKKKGIKRNSKGKQRERTCHGEKVFLDRIPCYENAFRGERKTRR